MNKLRKDIMNTRYSQLFMAVCEVFKCNICLSVMNTPIYASCCMRMIGCEACVARCIDEGQHCPLCHATSTINRANIKSRVLCIDGTLSEIQAATTPTTIAQSDTGVVTGSSMAYPYTSPPPKLEDSNIDFQSQ